MALRILILKSFYQDSVVLMRLAQTVRSLPGVEEAAALMGTPSNQAILEKAGMASDESRGAAVNDLVLAVRAESAAAAESALEAGKQLISARKGAAEEGDDYLPRTLESALSVLPDANLVAISVPGEFAAFEAERALQRGLHVFLFSDNVSLEAEVRLKREAAGRGLLCMGPDCGTAYLNGTALGFANVVPRGRVGIVAASGTGLQAVASMLAGAGEGISQGIGVGGRDLSAAVGGEMTRMALDALSRDPATEAIVVISKPPDAS
ncbi:MAG: oxidoreductase, partial [bacterium]|nr:oxidoreductase [bacterium]